MPNLVAQGKQPNDQWARSLQAGVRQQIGREIGWATPWDRLISGNHLEVEYRDGRLEVRALRGARNPIYFQGEPADSFALGIGDHFVVGSTTFRLVDDQVTISAAAPAPADTRTFLSEELRGRPFLDPQRRFNQLASLPQVVETAKSSDELRSRLLTLVLAGVGRATAVAIMKRIDSASELTQTTINFTWNRSPPPASSAEASLSALVVLNSDARNSELKYQASESLVWGAIREHKTKAAVFSGPGSTAVPDSRETGDWAFCVPWPGPDADRWGALYVVGTFADRWSQQAPLDDNALSDDIKYVEVLVLFAASLLKLQQLNKRQAILNRFLSPRVLDALHQQEPDRDLIAREADVAVMFCDLRGFTKAAEKARSSDSLQELFTQVSDSLSIMTQAIIDQDGVVSDFQGDAAMGFWGWPKVQADGVLRACLAALEIRRKMGLQRRQHRKADAGFTAGIGIAAGRALAGIIGTPAQGKVGVFGPTVNLASRLETLTRQVRAAIILDPAAKEILEAHRTQLLAEDKVVPFRVRRLARVRPAGLAGSVEIFELLPPEDEPGELTDAQVEKFACSLEAFEHGDWGEAATGFAKLLQADPVSGFLFTYINSRSETPPQGWDGTIEFEKK